MRLVSDHKPRTRPRAGPYPKNSARRWAGPAQDPAKNRPQPARADVKNGGKLSQIGYSNPMGGMIECHCQEGKRTPTPPRDAHGSRARGRQSGCAQTLPREISRVRAEEPRKNSSKNPLTSTTDHGIIQTTAEGGKACRRSGDSRAGATHESL